MMDFKSFRESVIEKAVKQFYHVFDAMETFFYNCKDKRRYDVAYYKLIYADFPCMLKNPDLIKSCCRLSDGPLYIILTVEGPRVATVFQHGIVIAEVQCRPVQMTDIWRYGGIASPRLTAKAHYLFLDQEMSKSRIHDENLIGLIFEFAGLESLLKEAADFCNQRK